MHKYVYIVISRSCFYTILISFPLIYIQGFIISNSVFYHINISMFFPNDFFFLFETFDFIQFFTIISSTDTKNSFKNLFFFLKVGLTLFRKVFLIFSTITNVQVPAYPLLCLHWSFLTFTFESNCYLLIVLMFP